MIKKRLLIGVLIVLVNWIIEKAYNAGYSFYDRKNRVIKSLNANKDLLLHARDLAPF